VLALVLAAALGPSLPNAIVAISIPIVPRAARVIRASVLGIRELTYVESARALGARHVRVALRHILPNTMGPFIVLATAQLGGSILVEAALSFLGLGIPEPYPSWGRMLSIAAAEYAEKAPWLVIWPGLAISLAVFGTNLLGDALRDTLDPRLRGSRTCRVLRTVSIRSEPPRNEGSVHAIDTGRLHVRPARASPDRARRRMGPGRG